MGSRFDSKSQTRFRFALSLATVFMACARFPSQSDVEAMISSARQEKLLATRTKKFGQLLQLLSKSDAADEDKILDNSIQRLAAVYNQTKDVAILNAIDEVPLDGGFANAVCGFYPATWNDTAVVDRYRRNAQAQAALRRCVGLSVLESDFQSIILGRFPDNEKASEVISTAPPSP